MPFSKREVNEYLFYEFGLDSDLSKESSIADDWPFLLTDLGSMEAGGKTWRVYGFADDEDEYFAFCNGALNLLPKVGMTVEALAMELDGAHWIGDRKPVDLSRTEGPESDTPSVPDRRTAIESLAAEVDGGARFQILEGLYLKASREYLALVQDNATGKCHVVGNRIRLRNIPYAEASPSRRLSLGIGKILRAGLLS